MSPAKSWRVLKACTVAATLLLAAVLVTAIVAGCGGARDTGVPAGQVPATEKPAAEPVATPEEVVRGFIGSLSAEGGAAEAIGTYGSASLTSDEVQGLVDAFPALAKGGEWTFETAGGADWFAVAPTGKLVVKLGLSAGDAPKVTSVSVVEVVRSVATARKNLGGMMVNFVDNSGRKSKVPLEWMFVDEGEHRLSVTIRTNDSSIVEAPPGAGSTKFGFQESGYDFVSIVQGGKIIAESAYGAGPGDDAGAAREVQYYFAVPNVASKGLALRIEGYPDLSLD